MIRGFQIFRKGPTVRVGREVPHAGGGEEPHGDGEYPPRGVGECHTEWRKTHTEVGEKATRGGGKPTRRWERRPPS